MTVCLRQNVFITPPVCVVADELGYFADAGLAVETVLTTSSTDQRGQLLGAGVDLGVTALDNVIVWNAAGADLCVIGQIESTTLLRLVARPSIHAVEGLRGSRIGVDALGNGFAIVLRHRLLARGLTAGDYELHPVGGVRQRFEALQSGAIDATLLGPPLDELARDAGLVSLIAVEEEVPDFPGQVIVVPAGRLEKLSGKLKPYLSALNRARRWLHDSPDDAVVEVLTAGGYGPASARASLRTRPASLVPPRAGFERLLAMRRDLDMMPTAAPRFDDIYAGHVLNEVTAA
jgi:ABC-type nitrate/sulfonate/bicarbonate transport system substrate-binding protein